MRPCYLVYLALILALGAGACYLVAQTPLGSHPRIASVLQIAAVTIALFSAIAALASSERRRIRADVDVERGPRGKGSYKKKNLTGAAVEHFKHFSDEFRSHAIGFRIKNKSGFTLQRPAIRFSLNTKYAHPVRHPGEPDFNRDDKSKHNYWGFNANTPGWTTDCRYAEYGDSATLSLLDLAPLNDGQDIPVWVRMIIDRDEREDFPVTVSISAENAEGWTRDVDVPVADLLSKSVTRTP